MSCCTSAPKGNATRSIPGKDAVGVGRTGSGVSSSAPTRSLRYVGASAVRAYGPFTHHVYEFRTGQVRGVDARDAAALLANALFRPA
jgi:hypothetical protein